MNSISVGSGTNIQDNSLVHVAKSNLSGKVLPTIIGDNVTIGTSLVYFGHVILAIAYNIFVSDSFVLYTVTNRACSGCTC